MINVKKEIENNRRAIKPDWTVEKDVKSDRILQKPRPETFKKAKDGAVLIELVKEFPNIMQKTLTKCIENRRSLRQYKDLSLRFDEMSYILWETARVDKYKPGVVFRTIPTGGATNAMETYVYIEKVEGIKPGLYHYLQDKHVLALIDDSTSVKERINEALLNQLRGAAMVLVLTTVPYRSEYKYQFTAHKMIAMEAGHAFQNASLAAEVIDAGGVCIAAYDQAKMDAVLQVDGCEEFSTYAFPLGKK